MAAQVSKSARSGFWGEVPISQGNLDNAHFYMRSFVDRFPADLIGGSSKDNRAPRLAVVDWGGAAPVETDIDGEKQFFRSRGWVRDFFQQTGAVEGDFVRIEETAPYRYRVTLIKKGAP